MPEDRQCQMRQMGKTMPEKGTYFGTKWGEAVVGRKRGASPSVVIPCALLQLDESPSSCLGVADVFW